MVKETLFSLEDVSFSYIPGEPVFSGLNLRIQTGESLCILGANGSGKSTLLKILAGLIFPGQGRLIAWQQEITERLLQDDREAKEYHRRIGYVFQNPDAQLFTSRVWDEIAFGPLQLGLSREEVFKRVEDVMAMLGIQHLQERPPYRLSGGEKKKVAIASVLALNPEVLILDEPTTGLDPRTQHWLVELLLKLKDLGRTIICATHSLDLAHAIADRAVVLSEQHHIVYDGSAQKALTNKELLMSVNLIDEFQHVHEGQSHSHWQMHA